MRFWTSPQTNDYCLIDRSALGGNYASLSYLHLLLLITKIERCTNLKGSLLLWWFPFWREFPLSCLICTQLTFWRRHQQGRRNKTSLWSLPRPHSLPPPASVPYFPPFLAFSSRQCQKSVAICRQRKLRWRDRCSCRLHIGSKAGMFIEPASDLMCITLDNF